MTKSIPTLAELMEKIHRNWEALNTALEGMSEWQLISPRDTQGWSVKDHLTHLTAWERSAIFFLQGKPRYEALGISLGKYLSGSEDEQNAAIQEAYKDLPLSEVLEQLHSTHQQLVQILGTMNDQDLSKSYRHYLPDEPIEGPGRSAYQVVDGNSANHYAEHLPWIKAIAGQERG